MTAGRKTATKKRGRSAVPAGGAKPSAKRGAVSKKQPDTGKRMKPATAGSRSARRVEANARLTEFMKQAYAMELEASERYAEFADQMDVVNNKEVADLFRKLSKIEGLHAKKILEQMRWTTPPEGMAPFRWEGVEGPETASHDALHYLMQPYHALEIALHNEERAARFFASISRRDLPKDVLAAAEEMAEEEREHVELVKAWMARVPRPEKGWDIDLDPPAYND